jgi:GNAT superfamily N-acetyltransferase
MISKLGAQNFDIVNAVINEAAVAFKGNIPEDCWKEPYMSREELKEEITLGVQFYGYSLDGIVVGVMGIQPVGKVTLIRHAYTISKYQHRGIGAKLLNHLLGLAETPRVLVGTWTDATWAIKFYQDHGFQLLTRTQTNNLLHKYWRISERQVETSVVLQLQRPKK